MRHKGAHLCVIAMNLEFTIMATELLKRTAKTAFSFMAYKVSDAARLDVKITARYQPTDLKTFMNCLKYVVIKQIDISNVIF